MTCGVEALGAVIIFDVLDAIVDFTQFNEDNDPWDEHDFGALEIAGHRIFWKIEYHNTAMTAGSEDPSDPTQTTRVMTVMLAEEY